MIHQPPERTLSPFQKFNGSTDSDSSFTSKNLPAEGHPFPSFSNIYTPTQYNPYYISSSYYPQISSQASSTPPTGNTEAGQLPFINSGYNQRERLPSRHTEQTTLLQEPFSSQVSSHLYSMAPGTKRPPNSPCQCGSCSAAGSAQEPLNVNSMEAMRSLWSHKSSTRYNPFNSDPCSAGTFTPGTPPEMISSHPTFWPSNMDYSMSDLLGPSNSTKLINNSKRDNKKTRTKEKYRQVYSEKQKIELEKEYHFHKYIALNRKQELSCDLSLSVRQIKIWFQNRRAKERRCHKRVNPKIFF